MKDGKPSRKEGEGNENARQRVGAKERVGHAQGGRERKTSGGGGKEGRKKKVRS